MFVWAVLRLVYHTNKTSSISMRSCPFFEKTDLDYVYEVPSCIILVCNTFFLLWIIVVSKIKCNRPKPVTVGLNRVIG